MRWTPVIEHLIIGYGLGISLFWIIWAMDCQWREWPHQISLFQAINLLVIITAIFINALN